MTGIWNHLRAKTSALTGITVHAYDHPDYEMKIYVLDGAVLYPVIATAKRDLYRKPDICIGEQGEASFSLPPSLSLEEIPFFLNDLSGAVERATEIKELVNTITESETDRWQTKENRTTILS